MNFRLDPVHGKRHQPHTTARIKALHRLHQADIAFLDQIGMRQAIAEIAPCDGNHQPQMRQHQLARRINVTMVTQTLRQMALLRLAQQRIATRRLDISVQVTGSNRNGKRHGMGHGNTSSFI